MSWMASQESGLWNKLLLAKLPDKDSVLVGRYLWDGKTPTALQAGSSIASPPLRRRSIGYCGLHTPGGTLGGSRISLWTTTHVFRVVLHLLVVFTEQLFATLVSSGGNRRLSLAALNNRDFVGADRAFNTLLLAIYAWACLTTSFWAVRIELFQISCLR